MLLDVVLWNCDVKKGITAEMKNASITHVARWIVNNIPGEDLFILAQELKTMIVQDNILTELETRGFVQAEGKRSLSEALVYYVSKHNLPSELVQRSDLQRVSMKYDTHAPDLGRMSVQKLDLPGASLLVVSWHGMWNKLSDEQLLMKLDSMMDFIEKVRQKQKCRAVIIGGDFNLPSHKAIQAVREASKEPRFKNATVLDEYTQPPPRTRCVDYILWWSDGSVEIIQQRIHVIKANNSKGGTDNFDHPVIHYNLQVHIIKIPRNPSTPTAKARVRSAHGLPYTAKTKEATSPTASAASGGKESRSKPDSASSQPKTTKVKTSTDGETKRSTPPKGKPSIPSPTASAGKPPQSKQASASSKSPSQTTKAKAATAGGAKTSTPPRDWPPTPTAAKPPRTPRVKSAASKADRKGSATGARRQSASVRYPPEWEEFLGTNEPVPAALWERPPQSRGRARPQHFFQWSLSDTFL